MVEIFILRLVHLESGIFMMKSCFFFVQVGSTESGRNGLLFLLMKSFLSAYVCGCNLVKGRPVGVIEFDVMNCCREVFVVIPWGNGPGVDV